MKKAAILLSVFIDIKVYGQITQPEQPAPAKNIVFIGTENAQELVLKLTDIGKYFSCKFSTFQYKRHSTIQKECQNTCYFFEPSWSPLNTFVGYKKLDNQLDLKRIYQDVSLRGYQPEKMDELQQKYNAADINLDMTSQFFNRFVAYRLSVNSKTWKDSLPVASKKYILGSKYCMGKGSCGVQIDFFKRLQRCNIQDAILENRYDPQGCFQQAVDSQWVRNLIPKTSTAFNPEHNHEGNENTRETIVLTFLLAELLKRNGYQ